MEQDKQSLDAPASRQSEDIHPLRPTLSAPEGFHARGMFPLVLGFEGELGTDIAEAKDFLVVLDSPDGAVAFEDNKRVALVQLVGGSGSVMARLTRPAPRAFLRAVYFLNGRHFGEPQLELF